MDREKLVKALRKLLFDRKGFLNFEVVADYILDSFVAKEEVYDLRCELEKWKALKTNVFPQDSKPRECDYVGVVRPTWTCSFCGLTNYVGEDCKCNTKHTTFKPKPTLPDVPEKMDKIKDCLNEYHLSDKINDLIDCYSALKKIVEEKL